MKPNRIKPTLKTVGGLLAASFLAFQSANATTTVVFDDSFAGEADGALAGALGGSWGAQPNWTIAAGQATLTGNWQRAEKFVNFRAEVGDQVRITMSGLSVTGTGGTGSDHFTFGFANENENTGGSTPLVSAGLAWDGTALSIGGATDSAYGSGDLLDIVLLFTRTAADAWSVSTTIDNLTDITNFAGSTAANNSAGGSGTVGNYFDADPANTAQFGMRANNNTAGTLAIEGIKLETITIPEPSVALLGGLSLLGLLLRRR